MVKHKEDYTKLAQTACFLLDMDGTLYLGDDLLPGATELIAYLEARQVPYFLLTNNSSKSRLDYTHKLINIGLPVAEEKIFSSGEATAIYLRARRPGSRLYVVGTPSLQAEFVAHGFHLDDKQPDSVVLGFDTTLTYEKLWKLCDFVRLGLPYIATHPDINCPTPGGYMPDIGSMIALVAASTGRGPDVVIGKPNPPIISAILEKTGLAAHQLTMVGDRLYTDIAMGQAGITTVLVLSGETKQSDIPSAQFPPNYVMENVAELLRTYRTLRPGSPIQVP